MEQNISDITNTIVTPINGTTDALNDGFTVLVVIKIIILAILILVGIIGNTLVIVSVRKEKNLNIPGNLFIVNLAFADLIISGLSLPIILHNVIHDSILPNGMVNYELNIFCQASAYLKIIALHVSWYSFAFIAINRYYCVCRPIRYSFHFTRARVLKTLLLIWAWVFIINLPVMVGWAIPNGRNITNSNEGYYRLYPKNRPPVIYDQSSNDCIMGIQDHGGYLFANGIFVVALPLITITFCYSLVFMSIVKNRRRLQATMGSDQLRRRYQTERRTFFMLVAVVMLFVVSWLPVIIYENVHTIDKQHDAHKDPDIVRFIVTWLALSNSVMNPILYVGLNRSFRVGYRHVVMDCLSCLARTLCGCCMAGRNLSAYFVSIRTSTTNSSNMVARSLTGIPNRSNARVRKRGVASLSTEKNTPQKRKKKEAMKKASPQARKEQNVESNSMSEVFQIECPIEENK